VGEDVELNRIRWLLSYAYCLTLICVRRWFNQGHVTDWCRFVDVGILKELGGHTGQYLLVPASTTTCEYHVDTLGGSQNIQQNNRA
jgi:hypothetical protein